MPHITEQELQQIADVDQSRRALVEDGRLSLAPAFGQFVIFVAGRSSSGYSPADYAAFMQEAEAWQAEVTATGAYDTAKVVEHAGMGDVMNAIDDPEVAGLTVIGHGTIGEYWTENGSKILTWQGIARRVGHLKQGEIWQATCGHSPQDRGVAVPLFTPAIYRLSMLRGAPGAVLPDEPIDYHEILLPIFNDEDPLDEQLITLNGSIQGKKRIIDTRGRTVRTRQC